MKPFIRNIIPLLFLATFVSACSTQVVKSTTYTQVIQDTVYTPEELLLDVGISIFDPGIDEIDPDEEETTNHQIRVAEAPFAAFLLAETLQRSANWGIVRVLPNNTSPMDINLKGTILQSNGEAMRVRVNVTDSTGREWYSREYHEVISQFSYDPSERSKNDPFQVIYNKIANDLLEFRKDNIEDSRISELRTVSELLFAQRFAPEVFGDYLGQNRDGYYQITRLPADNDPILARVYEIRDRDFMYIDTVQDFYATYTRQMQLPYDSWREQSYYETITLRELEASARRRFIGGGLAAVAGIAGAATSNSYLGQSGGIVAASAGAYLIKSGFDKRAEAQIHMAAIEELGLSLENEVAPKVIDLEDRTVTLTGNIEEQYQQWMEILSDMYAAEVGAQ